MINEDCYTALKYQCLNNDCLSLAQGLMGTAYKMTQHYEGHRRVASACYTFIAWSAHMRCFEPENLNKASMPYIIIIIIYKTYLLLIEL